MKLNNFQKRTLSALVIFPLALYVISYGSWLYIVWVLIIGLLMIYEWQMIVNQNSSKVFSQQKGINILEWRFIGVIYASVFMWAMLSLRAIDDGIFGYILTMWLIVVVCATDIGGYFFGRLFGGPKIAPHISPSKTWSGLGGGMFLASISAYGFYVVYGDVMLPYLFSAPFFAIVAQVGDFLESAFKRKFGVKDSGNIIPGHGGVMDRMDGFVTASLCLVWYSSLWL